MICQTSVVISSKIWAIENKLQYWLIAVAVPPLRKGKDGRVDDVCYTCTAFIDQEHENFNGCSVMSR